MVYDRNAPLLLQRGYYPLPTAPADFKPGKSPVKWVPGPDKFVLFSGWSERTAPVLTPQPGANIGVRCGNGLVAFDYDDEEAALKIAEVFQPSPVNKAGQRAWTPFYRADFNVPSEDFFDGHGRKVLQILSTGRQTVIPPSIHPDTNESYRWTNGKSLYDTSLSELPLLPRGYRERILALGYSPKRSAPEATETFDPETGEIIGEVENGFTDNPCAELNQLALKNLAAWVPDLGLYKCRRRNGRYPSYEAVATWRESTTGKPLEERSLNLKIIGRGIKDFGDDRGYSPLDLVMAARSCSLSEAFEWLEGRLLPKKAELEIDLERVIEAQDAPSTAPEDEGAPDSNDAARSDDDIGKAAFDADLALLGEPWRFGEPLPASLPMLVPFFVPAAPSLGYLGGQWGSVKTFISNDLAVAIASGGEFAGQQVTRHGLVVQVELEGSKSKVRVHASAKHRSVVGGLPIVQFTKTPPPILVNGRVNSMWKPWAGALARWAKRTAHQMNLPLSLITIDPLNHFSGIKDNSSQGKGNAVSNALIALSKDAGCPLLVVDHHGKDEERGLVGTGAKEQNAHFILGAGETLKDITKPRQLVVRKMKDGEQNIYVEFALKKIVVGIPEQVIQEDGTTTIEPRDHDTLVIKWEKDIRVVGRDTPKSAGDLTDWEQSTLTKLIELINDRGRELPAGFDVPGLRGVGLDDWHARLVDAKLLKTDGGYEGRMFSRLQGALSKKGAIKIKDAWVWIPLVTS
jgi:hypothetical protein